MAWCPKTDKSLPEPALTKISGKMWRHKATVRKIGPLAVGLQAIAICNTTLDMRPIDKRRRLSRLGAYLDWPMGLYDSGY